LDNAAKFKPIGRFVLVKRDQIEKMVDGIIIPEKFGKRGNAGEVLKIGQDVGSVQKGDRIFFLKQYTVLPFRDRDAAVTEDFGIIARLIAGKTGDEMIMPVNSFVLVEPEPDTKEKDGIVLPDGHEVRSERGRAVICGDLCEVVKPDMTVFYRYASTIECVERDKVMHLVNESDILCIGDDDG